MKTKFRPGDRAFFKHGLGSLTKVEIASVKGEAFTNGSKVVTYKHRATGGNLMGPYPERHYFTEAEAQALWLREKLLEAESLFFPGLIWDPDLAQENELLGLEIETLRARVDAVEQQNARHKEENEHLARQNHEIACELWRIAGHPVDEGHRSDAGEGREHEA